MGGSVTSEMGERMPRSTGEGGRLDAPFQLHLDTYRLTLVVFVVRFDEG